MPIDLTVIADRSCATSRSYLAYLRANGKRPRKILLVDFVPATRGIELARRTLGAAFAFRMIQGRRAAQGSPSSLFVECCEAMQEGQPLYVDYFGRFPFEDHAQEVERCTSTGFGDPAFQAVLRRQPGALLYTCGDRVPSALTDDPSVRILHIHPGVVPMMRGSDGLLWSIAVRGRPGASCFYMDAGLDTGALIATMEFEPPRFPGLARLLDSHERTLYDALLFSYDPHLRARLLVHVLQAHPQVSLRELPATAQSGEGARTWYAMHARLRRKVFAERILC